MRRSPATARRGSTTSRAGHMPSRPSTSTAGHSPVDGPRSQGPASTSASSAATLISRSSRVVTGSMSRLITTATRATPSLTVSAPNSLQGRCCIAADAVARSSGNLLAHRMRRGSASAVRRGSATAEPARQPARSPARKRLSSWAGRGSSTCGVPYRRRVVRHRQRGEAAAPSSGSVKPSGGGRREPMPRGPRCHPQPAPAPRPLRPVPRPLHQRRDVSARSQLATAGVLWDQ